jgi:hypothetical protein
MKKYTMTADGRTLSDNDANAVNELTEDVPVDAPPTDSLPPMRRTEPDPDLAALERKGEGGMEKALEMLDEYEEGIPKRDPYVPQYEE